MTKYYKHIKIQHFLAKHDLDKDEWYYRDTTHGTWADAHADGSRKLIEIHVDEDTLIEIDEKEAFRLCL